MTLKLPPPIESYFHAGNGPDAGAVAACFTPDVQLRDEGQDYSGQEAVRAWAENVRRKYSFHAEPRSLDRDGEAYVVTAHLTGDFPGAPADLHYRFELAAGKIAGLQIN